MAMRLLPKNEIARQKSFERKSEVDEGAKLARRVDNLRETAANEEASLAKFRVETLKRVKIDVDSLLAKKTGLEVEVREAEKKLKELKKPLDAEWDRLGKRENELALGKKEVKGQLLAIKGREEKTSQHEKRLAVEERKLENERARIATDETKASALLDKAKESSIKADKRLVEIDVRVKAKTKELLSREAELAAKERALDLQRESQAARKKLLDDQERFINDKYATLERTINRINK